MANAGLDRAQGDVVDAPPSRATWGWFFAWLVVGALASLAFLSALTIGVFVLPVVVVTAVVVATRRGALLSWPGVVSGLGVPLFWVAFLNRSGPGHICTTTATSVSCVQEWSPWPWVAVGVLLMVVGAVLFAVVRRGLPNRATGVQP